VAALAVEAPPGLAVPLAREGLVAPPDVAGLLVERLLPPQAAKSSAVVPSAPVEPATSSAPRRVVRRDQ